jgi:hypothetical protein
VRSYWAELNSTSIAQLFEVVFLFWLENDCRCVPLQLLLASLSSCSAAACKRHSLPVPLCFLRPCCVPKLSCPFCDASRAFVRVHLLTARSFCQCGRCSRYCSTPQNKFDLGVALFSLLT